ncbi:MAG TPA: amino acid permease [Gemmatimonadales bacterium]|nr:amino acid permease [Gemmatimonadales bacterium]
MSSAPARAELGRVLGVQQLIYIVIGTVIGSGIFIVPGAVLRQSGGSVGLALLVWLVGGVLSLLGALTYAELGGMHPKAGGLYIYIRDAFGPFPAFLFGWTLFFIIGSGSVATLAVAWVAYLGQLVPLGPVAGRVTAIAIIGVIAVVNVRGTRSGARVQDLTTFLKVAGIVIMSCAFLLWGRGLHGLHGTLWPEAVSPRILSGFGLSMIGTLWAYEGWQYVTYSAGEAKDPQRTFHRGLVLGTAMLIAIYLLASVGYLAALGPAGVAGTDRVAADAATVLFGPVAGKLIALMILVSIFSAANGIVLTVPRAFFAMARDGIFFHRLAEVHPRFGTPAFAILACSAWAMLLAATGTFEQLLTYVVFIGWLFYGLGALSVFRYRRREPLAPRPFRVPGYPVTPVLFVASAAAIVINTIVAQPARAAVGLGVVLLGSPAYFIWRRRGATPLPDVLAPSGAGESRE